MTTKFSKKRLVNSKRFEHNRDALNAILKDTETYTFDEVETKLKTFYEGSKKKVKPVAVPAYDDITVKDIKARLADLKIDYSGATIKKELYELLKRGGNK